MGGPIFVVPVNRKVSASSRSLSAAAEKEFDAAADGDVHEALEIAPEMMAGALADPSGRAHRRGQGRQEGPDVRVGGRGAQIFPR